MIDVQIKETVLVLRIELSGADAVDFISFFEDMANGEFPLTIEKDVNDNLVPSYEVPRIVEAVNSTIGATRI